MELVDDVVIPSDDDVDDLLDELEELMDDEVEMVAEDDDKLLKLTDRELLLDCGGMWSFTSKKYQSRSVIELTGNVSALTR